jgi:ABC-type nitrate/sulfonate/bicarbonate transport system permease component
VIIIVHDHKSERGVGVMMAYALFAFNVEQVWLTVFVTVACAIASYGLVLGLERLVAPWSRPAPDTHQGNQMRALPARSGAKRCLG